MHHTQIPNPIHTHSQRTNWLHVHTPFLRLGHLYHNGPLVLLLLLMALSMLTATIVLRTRIRDRDPLVILNFIYRSSTVALCIYPCGSVDGSRRVRRGLGRAKHALGVVIQAEGGVAVDCGCECGCQDGGGSMDVDVSEACLFVE